jgi:hypothetical protein
MHARSLTSSASHVPHGEAQQAFRAPTYWDFSVSLSKRGGCTNTKYHIRQDTTHGNAQHMLIHVALRYKRNNSIPIVLQDRPRSRAYYRGLSLLITKTGLEGTMV